MGGTTTHFGESAPSPTVARGEDTTGRLAVVLDAAGRIESVSVPRLADDDALREAGPLTTALQEAWEQASFAHLALQPVAGDERARLQALGEDLLAGRFRVSPPPAPPRPSEVAPSLDELVAAAKTRRETGVVHHPDPPTSGSDTEFTRDGGVQVEVSAVGRPERVRLDPDWAARASAATMSGTLTRALTGAHREDRM